MTFRGSRSACLILKVIRLQEILESIPNRTQTSTSNRNKLKDFTSFGGFPGHRNLGGMEDNTAALLEYYNDTRTLLRKIIMSDVVSNLTESSTDTIMTLFRQLAMSPCGLVSPQNLSQRVGHI